MRTITLILFSLLLHFSYATGSSQYEVIKVWNFLKYYHPDLASGKINADSLFIKHIDQKYNDVNNVISAFTQGLGNNFTAEVISNNSKDVIDANQNFDWYRKNPNITKSNKKLLDNIYRNRYQAESHFYIPKEGYIAEVPNEKSYDFPKTENLPENYRLLTLAKIIGAIDYLYPHKYLMAKNSDQILENLVDECLTVNNRKDFEIILAKAVSTMEDTHAFKFFNQLNFKREIFHSSLYAAFDFQVREDYILVTDLILPEICEKANLAVGDKITSINGKKIQAIIEEKNKLLSTSNREGLLNRLSDYQNNLIWPDNTESKDITIQKHNSSSIIQSKIDFINPADKPRIELVLNFLKAKQQNKRENQLSDPNIAYFRIDQTFSFIEDVEDENINAEMEKIMKEAASKEAMVFDMRGYPDWGGFVYTYVYGYFSKKDNFFGKYFQQNLNNVGTFIYNENLETYFPKEKLYNPHPYNGKVFIIVNQETLSASEWNSMNLQHIFPQAITIGQQTAGADGDIKKLVLPGNYTLEFTGNAVFYPDGKQAQKVGVKIDKKLEYSDSDVLNKSDKAFNLVRTLMGR